MPQWIVPARASRDSYVLTCVIVLRDVIRSEHRDAQAGQHFVSMDIYLCMQLFVRICGCWFGLIRESADVNYVSGTDSREAQQCLVPLITTATDSRRVIASRDLQPAPFCFRIYWT